MPLIPREKQRCLIPWRGVLKGIDYNKATIKILWPKRGVSQDYYLKKNLRYPTALNYIRTLIGKEVIVSLLYKVALDIISYEDLVQCRNLEKIREYKGDFSHRIWPLWLDEIF